MWRRSISRAAQGLIGGLTFLLLQSVGCHAQSSLPPCPGNHRAEQWNNCFGAVDLRNGDKYVGEFKDGKFNGQGTWTTPNGEKYVGEFKDDKRNGQGTYTWPNGRKYVGDFAAGGENGLGVSFAADGSVIHAGIWENGQFVRDAPVPRIETLKQKAAATPAIPAASSVIAPTGRRVALVIGNARYESAPRLPNPPNDAALIAATLRGVGFQNVTVRTDVTQPELQRALREFSALADGADWAVVYYSGHGMEVGGLNYLIPIDAKLKSDRDIQLEAIDVASVQASIEGAKKLRLIILDACRDNPFAKKMKRTLATRAVARARQRRGDKA